MSTGNFIYLNMFNYLVVLFFLSSILIYSCKDSFLMILISMEFMVLVVLSFIFYFEMNNFNEWIFLYYLIFSVCDGVLGLSIMVNMIFYMNSQNVSMVNLMW
uniref:NADH dehydrogenase subunit 4L n=1 Tax=Andrena chekiangensis TaxID=2572772 RepID=A0A4D6STR6_9HYME|nr:NADH dehydrogenase subunit 4L [Andrena chekiangensis]QCG69819.1 NADH dehydrogenase subunit 4L [Andrena chekiangensis]